MTTLTLILLLSLTGIGEDEKQVKPPPAAAPAQDPDRPTISTTELKALRDNNIFAPKSTKRGPKITGGGTSTPKPAIPAKPKPPVITAIFLDAASQAFQAIVEDKNPAALKLFKDPKFMKAGDEWSGITLESLTQDKAVFNKGGTSREVRIGESLPESEAAPLSASTTDDEFMDELEAAVAAEGSPAGTAPSPSAPPSTKKGRTRVESNSTTPPENQGKTLEEMKRRLKKNRPTTPEE
ncbi:MAG TPA: hypothetical protein VE981_01995 [Planctomycetota bacterium]|nr:hypothetical protein [Planctomycetota bacterium]